MRKENENPEASKSKASVLEIEGLSKTVRCEGAIRHEPYSLTGFIFRILKGPLLTRFSVPLDLAGQT
jgi:hypothetical protein